MQVRISQNIIESVESPQKIVSRNNYYAMHRTLDILYIFPRSFCAILRFQIFC